MEGLAHGTPAVTRVSGCALQHVHIRPESFTDSKGLLAGAFENGIIYAVMAQLNSTASLLHGLMPSHALPGLLVFLPSDKISQTFRLPIFIGLGYPQAVHTKQPIQKHVTLPWQLVK
jgi:hypothetical protein